MWGRVCPESENSDSNHRNDTTYPKRIKMGSKIKTGNLVLHSLPLVFTLAILLGQCGHSEGLSSRTSFSSRSSSRSKISDSSDSNNLSNENVSTNGHPSSQVRPVQLTYDDIVKTNKTCPRKDSCARSRHDRNGALMNDWKNRNCFCDQQCIVYEDCCVDSRYRRDPDVVYKKSDLFDCVQVRQFGSLYMRSKCPDSWKDELTRKQCEEAVKTPKDPISLLPLTNMETGFTYSNFYCALCNNQSFTEKMEMWKPRLECPSVTKKEDLTFIEENNGVGDRLKYRADQGSWGLDIQQGSKNVWHSCVIDPVIPEAAEYLIRTCKPVIKDCPNNYTDVDVHSKCLSYTAVVYHLTEGYRNVHCAICNGISTDNLICTPSGLARSGFNLEFNQIAFSYLFDLNPKSGLEVGKITVCSDQEIFDPFTQSCRTILCSHGQFYENGQCVSVSVSSTSDPLDNAIDNRTDAEKRTQEFDKCPKIVLETDEYEILDNGTVYLIKHEKLLFKEEYVVHSEDKLVVCTLHTNSYTDKFGPAWGYLSFAGVLVSAICLVFHLVACTMVPELRNLSGRNLASLCVALLTAYAIFLGLPFVSIPSNACTIMAVVLYYSLMASFCWMLILAWDVSMTLRRATQELRVSSGSQWVRFFFYSTFGWLFPAILVTVTIVAEFLPPDVMPEPYSPQFGTHNCWFGHKPALLIYFAGPVAFILLLNVILFIDAARLISSTTRGTAKAKVCGPTHQNFKLYLRLAILMGISWVLGIVAGYLDIPVLWIIFILCNSLQGVFIFFAFTCSSKVRKVLRAKCTCCAPSLPTASWTWSGIGPDQMARTTSSSSAHTKRSDLEGRDSSDSSHTSGSGCRNHHINNGHHHHHHHHHHSGMNFTHGGGSNGAYIQTGSLGPSSGKMYRNPPVDVYT